MAAEETEVFLLLLELTFKITPNTIYEEEEVVGYVVRFCCLLESMSLKPEHIKKAISMIEATHKNYARLKQHKVSSDSVLRILESCIYRLQKKLAKLQSQEDQSDKEPIDIDEHAFPAGDAP